MTADAPLIDALPSGSHLVLSHAASDLYPELAERVTAPEWFKDTVRPDAEDSGIYPAVARIP